MLIKFLTRNSPFSYFSRKSISRSEPKIVFFAWKHENGLLMLFWTCKYATNELRNEIRGTKEQQRTITYEINLIKQQLPIEHTIYSGDGTEDSDISDDEDYRQTVHRIQSASDLQTHSLRKNISRLENTVFNLQVKINSVRTEQNQKHNQVNRVIQRMVTR